MSKYKYSLDQVCLLMLMGKRFYATILSKVVKVPTDKVPTAGVGFNQHGKLTLFYNEEFLLSKPLSQITAILEHEVLHIFWRHLTRFNSKNANQTIKQIENMGLDCAINQYIPEIKALGDICLPEKFDLPNDQTADFYIEELKKKFKDQIKNAQDMEKFMKDLVDNHDQWEKVMSESGKMMSKEEAQAAGIEIDAEQEVQSVVMKAIKECKEHGSLPSFVKKEIERLIAKKRLDWKTELKIFINSVCSVNKRLSQKRVNRRFTMHEYILPGKKKSRKPNLLLVRDTSGSVFDTKTQQDFLNEMICISKFANILVADCDTEVHQIYKVRNVKDFKECEGGGGTSFVPAFDVAKKENVDGVIYLTDCYGDFPEKSAIGKLAMKTIWVTIGQDEVEIPFGKHVNIKR